MVFTALWHFLAIYQSFGAGTAFDQSITTDRHARWWRVVHRSTFVARVLFCKRESFDMANPNDYAGMAALTICESLMLALNDHNILPEREIVGVLTDAANTHETAGGNDAEIEAHLGAAALHTSIQLE